MRLIKTSIAILFFLIFLAGVTHAGNDMNELKPKGQEEKRHSGEDVKIDNVIEALSLIVYYKQWERNQEAYQEFLERRFGLKRHEDPFAFKSRMLRDFLEKDGISREEFERSVDDLEQAIDEIRHHYHK